MRSIRMARIGMVGALCALVGTGAGIAGSSAATKSSSKSSSKSAQARKADGPRGAFGRGGPPVHAEAVVLNKAGTGFVTVTEDNGTVKSVSGNELTLTENARKGSTTVTYKDVTLTIPSDATIRRNGETASLGALKEGDRVHVASSSDGTFVDAFDSSHRPPGTGTAGRRPARRGADGYAHRGSREKPAGPVRVCRGQPRRRELNCITEGGESGERQRRPGGLAR